MCGIVGFLHRDPDHPVDEPRLQLMNDLIAHRGPDDEGFYVGDGVGLGHRRLSVIDIAGGHQPMHDPVSARVLVYNGEVYNYRELRERLSPPPGGFRTSSDSEAVLRAVRLDSFGWLEELNGMFAFAVWDPRERTLLLVRDRLGIKPLYYAFLGDELVFSSEIKPLLAHPRVGREINLPRVSEYLAFRTLSGDETLYRGICKVPAGHALCLRQDDFQPRVVRWWHEGEGKGLAEHVDPALPVEEQLATLLEQAVRYRLIADVPVGSFNSGGVDSSLNASIMRSLTEGEMHTFSVGFEEAAYDEARYAERVATQLGTRHHTLVVTESQYLAHLDETLHHLEEPINHAHTVQLLLLSRLAREFVTVALTGEGADEVFGGYPRLQIPVLAQRLSALPCIATRALLDIARLGRLRKAVKLLETASSVERSILENARYVPQADLGLALSPPGRYPARDAVLSESRTRHSSVIGQALHFDQRTYLPGLLDRLDKSSMASALECRVPFIDYQVVEWSYRLADRYKIRPGRALKFLVKKVAERWLPRDIVYRKKAGFGTPVGQWLRNPKGLGERLDVLGDETFRARGLFDRRGVERLMAQHLQGRANHDEILWGLVNFELWCRSFIDAGGEASPSAPARGAPRPDPGRRVPTPPLLGAATGP